uniref:Uncharacterized protein n=1 Tax=Arundo donax TaxID=35708 RepID=A0A0A9U527_ARUDO
MNEKRALFCKQQQLTTKEKTIISSQK